MTTKINCRRGSPIQHPTRFTKLRCVLHFNFTCCLLMHLLKLPGWNICDYNSTPRHQENSDSSHIQKHQPESQEQYKDKSIIKKHVIDIAKSFINHCKTCFFSDSAKDRAIRT